MQFDFFALSTTLIDTAKLQLLPESVSTYVYLCPFMSTYCFLNAVTQYVVLGGLRLRFVGTMELWNYGGYAGQRTTDNGQRRAIDGETRFNV